MKFESLNLHTDILKGLSDAGFERCTPIQELSLPTSLAGKDLIAQSQTGSGKTAVFLFTIFNRLIGTDLAQARKPRALIVVPTRELATQVNHDAEMLGKHLALTTTAIYGGVEYDKQIKALKDGVDLVVATPGRLIDLYKSKTLSLDSIDIFVVDEADRMFDMGFAPDIRFIANHLPKKRPRQTMLFSATIDSNVKRLAAAYMHPDPVIVEVEPEQVTVNTIDQKILYVSNEEKLPVLLTLLKRPETKRTIIFTNMKRTAEMLGWKLKENGLPASVLTGDVSQARRERIMNSMKSGKLQILVATDVAARGLHIEDVTHVINYDLPEEASSYVHRIGRTARAGKSGMAYSLGCENHVINLPEIEKFIEHKIECEWIEPSEMATDKAGPYRPRRSSAPGPMGARRSDRGPRGRGAPPPRPRRKTGEWRGKSGPAKEAKPEPKPAEPTRPAEPARPEGSAGDAKPARPESPAKPASPARTESPAKPASPARTESPARTASPARPPRDAKAESPDKPAGSDRPDRPARPPRRRRRGGGPRSGKQEGASRPQASGEKQGTKPESKQGAKPYRPKAGAGSKGGPRPDGGRPRRRPQPGRGKRYEKPSDAQDARMAIYKNKYGEESTKPEKKTAKAPEAKEGLFKRVIKSLWKK